MWTRHRGTMDEDIRKARAEVAHSFLMEARAAHRDARRWLSEVQSLEDSTGIKGTDYSAVRVASSADPDGVHRLAMRHMEVTERYLEASRRCIDLHDAASVAIDRLDSHTERQVLSLYYLSGKSMQQVADAIGYSKPGVQCIKQVALCDLYEFLPEELKLPEAL